MRPAVPITAALLLFAGDALAGPVIPPGREDVVLDLLRVDAASGCTLGDVAIERTKIRAEYGCGSASPTVVELRHPDDAEPGDRRTGSFAVAAPPGPLADAVVASVTAHEAAWHWGPDHVGAAGEPTAGPREPFGDGHALRRLGLRALAAAALLLLTTILALRRFRPALLEVVFKPLHLLPAVIQSSIFLYWSIYWAPIRDFGWLVAGHLAFAFVLDAAVSLATRRKLVLGFAPVPIVLSTDLFVQFSLSDQAWPLAAITVAVLSKAFLRRKSGEHIFNPSALGVSAIGLFDIFGRGAGDHAVAFGLPPNMTEVIFLAAFIPQSRRPIVGISIAALIADEVYRRATGLHYFGPVWAPVFLAIALLATDPATTPRTGTGRVVFGGLLGFGILLAATILDQTGHHDFYGKVLPVPIVNALAPWCDRVGARLGPRVEGWLGPAKNKLHMAFWAVLVVSRLGVEKPGALEPTYLAADAVPLVQRDAEGAITCAANPTFCRPFTFAREASLWAARLRGEAR